MNNGTTSRRAAGPVRQRSLQQPPPRRPQQIRRQRSSEDEKTVDACSSSVGSRGRYATNRCDLYNSQTSTTDRPKVRVAWGEHQASKSKNEANVEIVAKQIPTGKSSRPTTGGRASRRCPLAEKATFLYSRQELAERLRLAWRQREENKSNIDIFLAHNTVEERSESRLSTMTNRTVSTPKLQASGVREDEARIREKPRAIRSEDKDAARINADRFEYLDWFSSYESNESAANACSESLRNREYVAQDENKENIDSAAAAGNKRENAEVSALEKKSSISINCNDWNASVRIKEKPRDKDIDDNGDGSNNDDDDDDDEEECSGRASAACKEADYSRAKLKRASFQSGLNKAFNTPVVEKASTPRNSCRVNAPREPIRFRRTNSAPPQRRTQVNIVIEAPGITSAQASTIEPERPRAMSANEQYQSKSRGVKSASTAKRRSKTSKRRGLSVAYSKDATGEDGVADNKAKAKLGKTNKNALMDNKANVADVVTMVSLISSADSESEMDDNSPRDDKLISELRSKLPTTPIIKSSNGLSNAMRKPFKSVSFQQDSFDYDSPPPSRDDATVTRTTSNLQARFVALSKAVTSNSDDNSPLISAMTFWKMESVQCANPITTIPTMSLQQQQEAPTTEQPLTDREKRCLAVPIGDVLDKKRKLVRCRSAVVTTRDTNHEKRSPDANQTCLQTEMRLARIASRVTLDLQDDISSKAVVDASVSAAEISEDKTKAIPSEPYCQTPKEKECWHLYRKMCDKGVFVSFDTVLRGMLTPTEYRLRQKQVSQRC